MGPPFIIVIALLNPLPLLADRWLAPRLPGFASTLVYPLAMTAFAYIGTATSPFGSSGRFTYSQYDNLVLLQLVSLTGMWGLAFLIDLVGSGRQLGPGNASSPGGRSSAAHWYLSA